MRSKVMENIEGQLSIFDITTPVKNERTSGKDSKELVGITLEQENVYRKYKNDLNTNRIMHYKFGCLGVELKQGEEFKTILINREGKEETIFNKKVPVLPWDRVIYFREKYKFNRVQVGKLNDLLNNHRNEIKRVIHRNGDENALVQYENKVLSVNTQGWILPFETLDHIECLDEEVFLVPSKVEEGTKNINKDIHKLVKVGDIVKAQYGKDVITGEITREYGLNKHILNIIYNNRQKHTAIGRHTVLEIIKAKAA